MIRKRSLLQSIRKTVYFSASKTRLSLRDCAQPGKAVTERALSAPSGHLSQRERQDMVVFTKKYTL